MVLCVAFRVEGVNEDGLTDDRAPAKTVLDATHGER